MGSAAVLLNKPKQADDDYFLMHEVREALEEAAALGHTVDLVGFDACLMGMAEPGDTMSAIRMSEVDALSATISAFVAVMTGSVSTWDLLTDKIVARLNGPVFCNFQRRLDAEGFAAATLDAAKSWPTKIIGRTVHFAFACNEPRDFASNPVAIEVVQ